MNDKTLHILNGDTLVDRLPKIGIQEDQLVWREMLCEGKTNYDLTSEAFKNERIAYLNQFKATEETYVKSFLNPLLTTNYENYTTIVLWFEYDLFCHINMIAVLSYLKQQKTTAKIYLVCSGWIENDTQLKGLGELSEKELKNHYEQKIELNNDDIRLADQLWKLYCKNDHSLFKKYITLKSSFPYLSNCISAHLKRFPAVDSGLNVLETNILKIIHKQEIKNERQLVGYVLQYQGYYGFGDLQIQNIIHKLAIFFETKNGRFVLNRKGLLAKDHIKSFYDELSDDTIFGNCSKYEYCYHPSKLILTKHE
ncbi:DUF1835 domain-containing protein [Kordia algicida OT-1]|uniref:Transcriptional regulator, AraC family protein n=1 Tax=Kordia algicida OT-1 TaxID=391587 RepID=A9EBF3_9FLAO|nr:hypothetical protein [Kordia algicida]EDP94462.1 transcriptional regulator, AraC family protein [Kordia algicida OT-1]